MAQGAEPGSGDAAGLEVETYTTPLRRARTTVFDAVITDYWMPDMDGIEMLQELWTMQPDTIRILPPADRYRQPDVRHQPGRRLRFVPKPWDDDQLLESVEEGLKFRDILVENKILAQTVRDQREALRSMGYDGE